jgi:hypothetical protein
MPCHVMRRGEPGVTRKRFKAPDSVDARHRLVRTDRSSGDRTERHFVVDLPQLANCFRAGFKLGRCLLN